MVGLPDRFNTQCPVCTYLYNYYTDPDTNTNTRLADHLDRIGTAEDTHRDLSGNYTANDLYAESIKFANQFYRDNNISSPEYHNNDDDNSTTNN